MKNKVVFIIPYFGKFPNYFQLWIMSAAANPEFDFIIYTDANIEKYEDRYENIIFKKISFREFSNTLKSVFEFKAVLDSPYKLCDYKPVYGKALADDISSYDFWGHCDIDLILGDLKHYINDEILDKFDKIYNLGHMTLYRNTDKINNLYRISHNFKDCFSYKYVYQTNFPTAYDEIGTKYGFGLSVICERIGIKNYISLDFADVLPDNYEFELAYTAGEKIDYFMYNSGKVFGIYKNNQKEFAYVHLQKRNLKMLEKEYNQLYYISPAGFREGLPEVKRDINSVESKKSFNIAKLYRKLRSKMVKVKQGAAVHLVNRIIGKINI